MGQSVSRDAAKFKPGDRVRVRTDNRSGHIRTPYYVRGKVGWIERIYGEFLNPESLAYGGDGLPKRTLYLVGFDQTELWRPYPASLKDKLLVDIYEHWLDPAS